ncbi:MAG TPA: hypothetical protein VIH57_20155 [Bacteroidales bacterium]
MFLNIDFFRIAVSEKGNLEFSCHWSVFAIAFLASLLFLYFKLIHPLGKNRLSNLKIDQVELGIGDQKISLSPNYKDRQIAHKLWAELNTRKIGIEIDFENDVIVELYNSWFAFFQITRELIKEISVENIKSKKGNVEFVDLAIDVLNKGLRPHLTKWQARFRRWYENEINQPETKLLSPQEIQKRFPAYMELIGDMKEVNSRLIYYKTQLRKMSRNE